MPRFTDALINKLEELITSDLTNKHIAKILGVSYRTVQRHLDKYGGREKYNKKSALNDLLPCKRGVKTEHIMNKIRKNSWISVEDSKPLGYATILVLVRLPSVVSWKEYGEAVSTAYFCRHRGADFSWEIHNEELNEGMVTHWQPCPETLRDYQDELIRLQELEESRQFEIVKSKEQIRKMEDDIVSIKENLRVLTDILKETSRNASTKNS